jgi:hypothetical protein
MRLLEGYTGGRLLQEQRWLEQLDGVLGEAHNCALLCAALRAGALESREDTARCLRLVRRYRAELRLEANAFVPLVHGITPREFVARVRRPWQVPSDGGFAPALGTAAPSRDGADSRTSHETAYRAAIRWSPYSVAT